MANSLTLKSIGQGLLGIAELGTASAAGTVGIDYIINNGLAPDSVLISSAILATAISGLYNIRKGLTEIVGPYLLRYSGK